MALLPAGIESRALPTRTPCVAATGDPPRLPRAMRHRRPLCLALSALSGEGQLPGRTTPTSGTTGVRSARPAG
eukprot:11186500-Lingulodinium_polyedra.AAC.1